MTVVPVVLNYGRVYISFFFWVKRISKILFEGQNWKAWRHLTWGFVATLDPPFCKLHNDEVFFFFFQIEIIFFQINITTLNLTFSFEVDMSSNWPISSRSCSSSARMCLCMESRMVFRTTSTLSRKSYVTSRTSSTAARSTGILRLVLSCKAVMEERYFLTASLRST